MREPFTAAGCAIVLVLLVLVPRSAAAQFAQHSPFARNDAPAVVTDFSAGQVHSMNEQFDADFYILGAFGGSRRLDRFSRSSSVEKPLPWKLYGRVGVFNFQNEIEPQYSQGLRFSWRRTGPRLTGRVYLGIHRTF